MRNIGFMAVGILCAVITVDILSKFGVDKFLEGWFSCLVFTIIYDLRKLE